MRLPLAVGLESRDGLLTKDAKTKNAILEVVGQGPSARLRARKRPGLSDQGLIRAGKAQLLAYWRDEIIAVIDDYINVNALGLSVVTTWDPANKGSGITLSNGDLTAASSTAWSAVRSVQSLAQGVQHWYWEVTITAATGGAIGFCNASRDMDPGGSPGLGGSDGGLSLVYYPAIGQIAFDGVTLQTGLATSGAGVVVGVFYDAGAQTVQFYRNGVALGTAVASSSVPAGALFAVVGWNGSASSFTFVANFGATPFTYTPSPGSYALSVTTADLPFSAQDNGENAPTPYLMVKSQEKAWTINKDFLVLPITDTDYPASYTVTLTSLTRSGATATATTAADTNFAVGDAVTIAGADQSDYNGVKIVTSVTPAAGALGTALQVQSITRSSTTATVTTVTPHGLTNGQTVLIEGAAQEEYNGNKTITWLSATTFSFTVTVTGVTTPATGTASVSVSSLIDPQGVVTVSSSTATVTTPTPHGLATGASVALSYYAAGVYQWTGHQSITVSDANTFTLSVSTSDVTDAACSIFWQFATTISAVTSSDGANASATTNAAHGLATGASAYLFISGLSPAYYNSGAGAVVITATGASAFTYPLGTATGTSPVTPATGTITATPRTQNAVGASFTFTVDNSPTTPATGTITATLAKNTVPGIVYFDGYFLVMDENGVVYNSKEDDPRSWEPLEYLIAQTETGAGKAIARTVNYVVCFKEWSTEFLWNQQNEPPGSPFSPVPNAAVLIGCVAGWSVANVGGALIWIGQGKKVRGRGVYMMTGTQPQKVSSPDIERVISRDDLTEVDAYGIELDGHTCYVLTLGDTDVTLVYDIVSGEWTQWSSYTPGSAKSISGITLSGTTATVTFGEAHTLTDGDPVLIAGANQAAYNGIHQVSYVSSTVVAIEVAAGTTSPATGTITGTPYTESAFKFTKYANCGGVDMVLHESDGHLYQFDSTLDRDAGIPIDHVVRLQRFDGGTMAPKKLVLLSVIGDTVSDTAMLRWSKDDGATWSAFRRVDLSAKEPKLRQCGSFKRRIFEYRHIGNTAPNPEAIELEITR